MKVARVIVDVPTRDISSTFDYEIPELVAPEVEVGSPVLVEFARRHCAAYVVELAGSSEYEPLKPVIAVLGRPVFGPEAAAVAEWMSEEYVCGLAEAVRPFLAPGGTPRVVRDGEGWRIVPPRTSATEERWVRATPAAPDASLRKGATLQRAVLDATAAGPLRMAELRAELGAVDGAVKALSERGLLEIQSRRRVRGLDRPTEISLQRPELTATQEAALEAIDGLSGDGGTLLLDGVTASGKTEVYLRAIERVLADDGSAIVLVPEISLTPQAVGRFRERLGGTVAVLHSRLPAGERYDQWDLVLRGQARVVVGPRSALFAPVRDLRLVVLDEEHEPSYKSGAAPRYHARAVARRLCTEHGAVLVLGSATPSLETAWDASNGRFAHAVLPERVAGERRPRVDIVDMGQEFADGNRKMFSRRLLHSLDEVERERGKGVLFLNRRGYASFLLCRECGHVPECDDCSVSLTHHEADRRLVCHHCGAAREVPPTCPACGSAFLRRFGAGTQRVEAELADLAPGLPVVRMDADTTTGKGGHERRLAEFEALESGVLLGTQMIAKGLDYPDVTLVGVVDADTGMHLPDFRSAERTYQLLEQVAGRAGRGPKGGHVVVQTYWPEHPAVRAVEAAEPSFLYESEFAARRELGYPPFGRLARLLLTGVSAEAAREAATSLADALRRRVRAGSDVLGPAPAPIGRVRRNYRWHVMLKSRGEAVQMPGMIGDAIRDVRLADGVTLGVDIDPMDLL
jgi:primosomal protein N' (replication factor Y)